MVWPVDTYAALLFLLPFGLLAEAWSYRGAILVGLACRLATRSLLLWGEGILTMQVMQVNRTSFVCFVATDALSTASFFFKVRVCLVVWGLTLERNWVP